MEKFNGLSRELLRRGRLSEFWKGRYPILGAHITKETLPRTVQRGRKAWADTLRVFRKTYGPQEAMRRKKDLTDSLKLISKKDLARARSLKKTMRKTSGALDVLKGAVAGVKREHQVLKGWGEKATMLADKSARIEGLARRARMRTWKAPILYVGSAIEGAIKGFRK